MFLEKVEIEGFKGGKGKIIIEKAKEVMENCKMYARITILPNSSIGMHVHEEDEEMVYVISGRGLAYINDGYIDITSGTLHYAKKGNKHSIENNGVENLVILAVINNV